MFHFMRLGLTTEGAETPVRAARKEACERIRFAQLGRNSPTLDGRQMICGRGVDEWHEVRLPPSSFRAPRSGFPRFQWLTDLSTAPRIKCAPSPDRGIDNSALSAQMDLTLFVYTLLRSTTKFNLARILQRLDITRNRRYALANVRRDFVSSHTWTQGNCVENSLCNPIIYSIILFLYSIHATTSTFPLETASTRQSAPRKCRNP